MDFCTNCGNQLNGEAFCTKCGAPTGAGQAQNQQEPVVPAAGGAPAMPTINKDVITKVCIGVVAVVVVGLLVWSVTSLFGGGYKRVLKKYVKAIEEANGEAVVELMYEDEAEWYAFIADSENDDLDDLADTYTDQMDHAIDMCDDEKFEIGDISYDIEDVDIYDADSDFVKKYTKSLEEGSGDYEVDLSIEELAVVQIQLDVDVDDESRSRETEVWFAKIDGDWYLTNNRPESGVGDTKYKGIKNSKDARNGYETADNLTTTYVSLAFDLYMTDRIGITPEIFNTNNNSDDN